MVRAISLNSVVVTLACVAVFGAMAYSRFAFNESFSKEVDEMRTERSELFGEFDKELSAYYIDDAHTPVWMNGEGKLKPAAGLLLNKLRHAHLDGLVGEWYRLSDIESLVSALEQPVPDPVADRSKYALLEVLLTKAFLGYAMDQYAGHVGLPKLNPGRRMRMREPALADSLERLSETGAVEHMLNAFACPHTDYKKLQAQLAELYAHGGTDFNDARVRTIVLNMERWRWMPRVLPPLYILVNIPAFELHVSDHGKDTLRMKIITGKTDNPTPVIEATMSHLIVNPWWEVPASIAGKEMLPELKKSSGYLARHHLHAYQRTARGMMEVNPHRMKWHSLSEHNFPYKLRQSPGPWNALGRIKFIFPNNYDVYLHDTPQRELFGRKVRAFSHGCIRIEKPVELAVYLLNESTENINRMINSKEVQTISIKRTPRVFIRYHTAWVDAYNTLQVAPDIYGHDAVLEREMKGSRPGLLSGM